MHLGTRYKPLLSSGEDGSHELPSIEESTSTSRNQNTFKFLHGILFVLVLATAIISWFAAGRLSVSSGVTSSHGHGESLANTTGRIPLPLIQVTFTYPSPFEKEPPQGWESGKASEPVWDALIPSKSNTLQE